MNELLILPTADYDGTLYVGYDSIVAVETWEDEGEGYMITIYLNTGEKFDIKNGFTKEEANKRALALFNRGEWQN